MKISRELKVSTTIRQITPDGIRIGETDYAGTIALTEDTVFADWTDKGFDELAAQDFDRLVALEPDVILLGTGARGRFAPRELAIRFARAGIGFEVMDTAAAARTFNVLAGEGRRVIAVLFPGRAG